MIRGGQPDTVDTGLTDFLADQIKELSAETFAAHFRSNNQIADPGEIGVRDSRNEAASLIILAQGKSPTGQRSSEKSGFRRQNLPTFVLCPEKKAPQS